MNQKDETNALLPEWLAEHTAADEKSGGTDTDLDELLEDHARLIEAIHYWNGKSAEKVEEFRYLAKELQQEIITMQQAPVSR